MVCHEYIYAEHGLEARRIRKFRWMWNTYKTITIMINDDELNDRTHISWHYALVLCVSVLGGARLRSLKKFCTRNNIRYSTRSKLLYKYKLITCDVKQKQIIDCVTDPCKENEAEDCCAIILHNNTKYKNVIFYSHIAKHTHAHGIFHQQSINICDAMSEKLLP